MRNNHHAGQREAANRRGGARIMRQLMGQVRPLLPVMLLAIVLGILGYLCAIFLTILAAYGLMHLFIEGLGFSVQAGDVLLAAPLKTLCPILVIMAVLRGLLHYGEQYCNHFIAFKLLAILRSKVFAALCRLCPAKLEGRDRGNLISLITTDIELLEVFYAHTISPIAIAIGTSVLMVLFLGRLSLLAGVVALAGYLVVGLWIPLYFGRRGGREGMEYRTAFGELNSFVLDSLHGIDETMQYGCGEARRREMEDRSALLEDIRRELTRLEARQRSVTNGVILAFSFGMMALMLWQRQLGNVDMVTLVVATVAMMGSFGPVTALAALSNNLNQTLASGERVLSLLEEEPMVEEIEAEDEEDFAFAGARVSHVDFSYDREQILSDYSLDIAPGRIIGLHGASGSGKSTLLKLLMRFWDADEGEVSLSGVDVRSLPTRKLRQTQSYVTQETHLFHDSIANNIAIGNPGATREEIVEAAKKAAIHEFIETLPKGYDTEVGELGDTLSGGEAQRIGIARAFLHNAPFLLLDEPTSNLDSLNEGMILKSLKEEAKDKTVLLVSHRKSTLCVADEVVKLKSTRVS